VNSLSDLANYVPGLSVSAGGAPGFRTIVLRGLSISYSNATTGPLVGTYVDDLPVGNSTAGARGAMYGLDLNPDDVDRVEVIKGPQGTVLLHLRTTVPIQPLKYLSSLSSATKSALQ
jgi:iron complex outermembrane receptor protein